MKPITVDMLRAHLLVASLTAMGVEALALLALTVLPVSQQVFDSASFRLFAIAVISSGVVVTREFAKAAFERAVQHRHAAPVKETTEANCPVAVTAVCAQRWLVVLHLRLTGRPFVLTGH
ncbi:hypothetical protein B0G69_3805 [Paraburkholderia sp. RAU2J]|uniref:hypothetical protein n=1 Tax=Paraburkholderia sp. RAU2J TaxID=1938810 RepID=UPI000EB5869E|nr:hypothetical protein [Paraburkholderia sp. RAU2J]RKT20490.1 hypothetical protein B0G69_3805 [Paraburkholderia sp. RAU2J]